MFRDDPKIVANMGVSSLKVQEFLQEWPLSGWHTSWFSGSNPLPLANDPGELRLSGFTGPSRNGWFSVVAADFEGREWSTSFCVDRPEMHAGFELVLATSVTASLVDIGELDIPLF